MSEAVIVNGYMSVDEIEPVRGVWLRRWWRVLLVGFILSLVVGGLVLAWQPQLYRARAALLVGSTLNSPNPESADIQASVGLARTYADLARRPVLLQNVIDELHLQRSPEQLAARITIRVQPGSQIIEITVVDDNPQTAEGAANALARALSGQAPAAGGEPEAAMAFASQQLAALQSSISNLEADVQRLQGLPLAPPTEFGPPASDRLAALQERLDAERAAYAGLLASYRQGASNTLTIVEPAAGGTPMPKPLLPVLAVAGLAGLALSAGGIAITQGLDDTLRWPGLAPGRCLGLPVLGAIGNVPPEKGPLFYPRDQSSPEAEALRDLAASIYLAGPQDSSRSLLITSPSRQDGKSFVAANLAAVLAATGVDVVLVDAALHQPSVHEAFGLKNDRGLSQALRDRQSKTSTLLRRLVRPSGLQHLWLITAGPQAMEQPLALYALRLREVLQQLQQRFRFVIVDGPAAEGLATDAGVLAALVGETVLVVKSGSTREEEARRSGQAIARRSGARVIGLVFNRALGRSTAAEGAEQEDRPPAAAAGARRKPGTGSAKKADTRPAAAAAEAGPAPTATAGSQGEPRKVARRREPAAGGSSPAAPAKQTAAPKPQLDKPRGRLARRPD